MDDNWYYGHGEERLGPVSVEGLRQLIVSDQVGVEDLVWRKGMDEWVSAGDVEGLFLPPPIPARFARFASTSSAKPRSPTQPLSHAPPPSVSVSPIDERRLTASKPPMGRFKKIAIGFITVAIFTGIVIPAAHKAVERQREKMGSVTGNPKPAAQPEPAKPEIAAKEQPAPQPNAPAAGPAKGESDLPGEKSTLPPPPGRRLVVVAKPHRKKPHEESLPEPRFSPQFAAALEKLSLPNGCMIRFSPRGNFLLAIRHIESGPSSHSLADLWQVSTGEKKNPKAQDCDYFSEPLVFSPDEKNVACVDGELLRIWDLTGAQTSLVCSIPIPKEVARADRLTWVDNDSIIAVVERNSGGIEYYEDSFAVFRRQPSGEFAPQAELITVLDKNSNAVFNISPRGTHVIVGRFGSRSVVVLEPYTKKHVAEFAARGKLSFSPNGAILVDSHIDEQSQREWRVHNTTTNPEGIVFWDTKTWQKVATVPGVNPHATGSEKVELKCFSRDSRFVAITRTVTVRTATSELRNSTVAIWDLRRGKLLHEIAIPGDMSGIGDYVLGDNNTWFDLAGDTLYVKGWIPKWGMHILHSWDVASGDARLNIRWKGSVDQLQSEAEGPHFAALSPDGQTMVVDSRLAGQPTWSVAAWNVGRMSRIQETVAEGDRKWESGNRVMAAEKYQSAISDPLSTTIRFGETPLWSRCIDAYAEKGDSEKARKVLEDALAKKLVPFPKTEPGKKFLADYQNAIAEANRRQAAKQNEAFQKQLEEERAQNRKDRVPAITQTRKQFIEKMQRKMSRGVINQMATNAVFENNSFQDSFGDPDKDLALDNIYHLISYRCSDGVIVLKVTSVEGTLVVTEINQL